MIKLIKDFAEVRSGLVTSRKQAVSAIDAVKEYKLLNLRCINEYDEIDLSKLDSFKSNEVLNSEYLTKKGDILTKLIEPFNAVFVEKGFENLVIPSHFCIIRVDEKKCNSKYLYYQLNGLDVKKQLRNMLQGSILKNVAPTTFNRVQINLTDLNEQKKISDLLDFQKQKIKLTERIAELEKLKNKFMLAKVTKGEIK